MRTLVGCILLGVLAWQPPSRADDVAVTVRDTVLRQEPSPSAAAVMNLVRDKSVMLQKRQGGWYQAVVEQRTGWVKLLDVRLSDAGARPRGGQDLATVLTGRTAATPTTGVRGLDEEKLRRAQPNLPEVARMEALTVSPAEANRFAQEGGLQAIELGYRNVP
ncbi:hypothetical protein [Chitinivorax sp. B]|uniref:hypothetical protein n=1 Tax=Chitinivorax sp. B TaxID=2502235 RepID=UPI0010FA13B7|nr:hypothetical protein [Chitinivorax sp. B]